MYKFRKNFIEIFNKNFHREKLNFVKISTSKVTRGTCCGRSGEQDGEQAGSGVAHVEHASAQTAGSQPDCTSTLSGRHRRLVADTDNVCGLCYRRR